MPPKPESTAEHGKDSGQPAGKWNHYAEIIRPETLGQWAIEKNPTLRYCTKPCRIGGSGVATQADPQLTCPHEFRLDGSLPPAWMFVRVSVNKAGVPKQMILDRHLREMRRQGRCDPAA